jgi:hypothetical protein
LPVAGLILRRVLSAAGPILLMGGDKSGESEKRFFPELTRKADARFAAHIERLKREK